MNRLPMKARRLFSVIALAPMLALIPTAPANAVTVHVELIIVAVDITVCVQVDADTVICQTVNADTKA
ncbi:hypothetical protein [Sphingomonas sp. 28-62-20]|uniref:hypothetical protein n=1 Tax=Sphingomonas sp. 28-62-20 TaxID=1970433 RepID=UPI0026BEAC43